MRKIFSLVIIICLLFVAPVYATTYWLELDAEGLKVSDNATDIDNVPSGALVYEVVDKASYETLRDAYRDNPLTDFRPYIGTELSPIADYHTAKQQLANVHPDVRRLAIAIASLSSEFNGSQLATEFLNTPVPE